MATKDLLFFYLGVAVMLAGIARVDSAGDFQDLLLGLLAAVFSAALMGTYFLTVLFEGRPRR
jgi:hypothetical protein